MDASRRAPYAPLAAILLFATLLQAVLLVRLPTISADGIIFIGLARQLAADPIETFRTEDQHPGFPAMLLGATRVVEWLGYRDDPGSWIAGGVAVSFLCGVLSVAVVWFLARDLFDARVAHVAAIAFTVLPVPRAGAVDAQSDTPHALFYLLAAWMATTGIAGGSLWRLAAAGLASGAAYWIRPEGLEVVLVALPFAAWQAVRAHGFGRRSALAVATLGGCAMIVAAPYAVLAGKVTSKQLQFAKVAPAPTFIEQLAAAEAPAAPAAATSSNQHRAATPAEPTPAAPTPADHEPASQPAPSGYSASLILSVLGLAVAAFINSICQGFKFVFIPLYLLGNVALAWRRPAGIQIAYLACLGATHIAILLCVYIFSGYIAHRHVIPLVGLAMPFAALGIVQCGDWLARRSRVAPAYGSAATLAVSAAIVLPYTLRPLNCEFLPVIEATRWVESRAEPGAGIVCNSPYVDFYGKLPVTELSPTAATLEEALAEAPIEARYDFVVLHVGAHAYRSQWLDEIEQVYEAVLELPDPHSTDKPRKVVVFQARGARMRHAARPPQ